jgi:hypothetical protein
MEGLLMETEVSLVKLRLLFLSSLFNWMRWGFHVFLFVGFLRSWFCLFVGFFFLVFVLCIYCVLLVY